MKKIIAFSIVMLVVLVSSVFAQDELPMLRSKDALRTYALEQTANVWANISTSTQNNWNSVPVTQPTAEGIIGTISSIDLSIDVINPDDSLYTLAGVSNTDGDNLFWGYNQFKLIPDDNGGYTLPIDYGNVTLVLSDNIPIKIDGAESAMIYFLDPSGQTREQYSLDVYNGKVYFPRQLAGENAILATYIQNNQGESEWTYWDVDNGSRISSNNFGISLKSNIQGITTVTDSDIWLTVPTENGIGNNVTIEIVSTKTQQIFVSLSTSEGKYSRGVLIRKLGETEWYEVKFQEGSSNLWLGLLQGVYYVIPLWNPEDLIEPEDPWFPPYYGGKG